jgi:hypothetical protein
MTGPVGQTGQAMAANVVSPTNETNHPANRRTGSEIVRRASKARSREARLTSK